MKKIQVFVKVKGKDSYTLNPKLVPTVRRVIVIDEERP